MSKSNYYKKLGRTGWVDNGHTSRSKETNFYDEDYSLEKPSTGKKKKKHSTPKKIDHKHEYVEVIYQYSYNFGGNQVPMAVIRKKCSICGKLAGWIHPSIKDKETGRIRSMTFEEIKKNYPFAEVLK